MNQEAIQKLKDLDELRALLSIDDKSKPKSHSTFYLYQGNVLKSQLSRDEYSHLSNISEGSNRQKFYIAKGDNTFELDTANLNRNGIEVKKADWGRPPKLVENKAEFQTLWDNIISQKAEMAKKELDHYELENVKKEFKEQLLNAKTKYEGVIKAGERDNVLMATFSKFMEYLDSLYNDTNSGKSLKQKSSEMPQKKLNWSGSDLELTELLKALIESKCFVGHTDKEVFETIFEFLGIEYTDNIKKERLSTIRKRTKDLNPFLEKLYANLEKWIRIKDN